MIQQLTQTYIFPVGVETELAQRCQAMLDEAGDRLWVRRGKSTFEEQLEYWVPWQEALKIYGVKEALKHCEIASFPSTSRHEEKLARAVDVMCRDGDESYRDELVKKHGLHAPIEFSPHHLELALKRTNVQKLNGKREYICALPSCDNVISRYASTVKDEATICCSKSCARYFLELRKE